MAIDVIRTHVFPNPDGAGHFGLLSEGPLYRHTILASTFELSEPAITKWCADTIGLEDLTQAVNTCNENVAFFLSIQIALETERYKSYFERYKGKRSEVLRRKIEQDVRLKFFRPPSTGPTKTGEWQCPLCKMIGRVTRADYHTETAHSAVFENIKKIEKSILPNKTRPVKFRGGGPGLGKRK